MILIDKDGDYINMDYVKCLTLECNDSFDENKRTYSIYCIIQDIMSYDVAEYSNEIVAKKIKDEIGMAWVNGDKCYRVPVEKG